MVGLHVSLTSTLPSRWGPYVGLTYPATTLSADMNDDRATLKVHDLPRGELWCVSNDSNGVSDP